MSLASVTIPLAVPVASAGCSPKDAGLGDGEQHGHRSATAEATTAAAAKATAAATTAESRCGGRRGLNSRARQSFPSRLVSGPRRAGRLVANPLPARDLSLLPNIERQPLDHSGRGPGTGVPAAGASMEISISKRTARRSWFRPSSHKRPARLAELTSNNPKFWLKTHSNPPSLTLQFAGRGLTPLVAVQDR